MVEVEQEQELLELLLDVNQVDLEEMGQLLLLMQHLL
tara:strand:+ start:245 stop:355 length:111 start_codon:yes stop_codon:yes gene_type:complete